MRAKIAGKGAHYQRKSEKRATMNIHHIHYAIEIAHYGSFNKAAANLFISQPSLSRAIKELERNLGFELFVRTPSGVVPTHQGQEFLRRASHLNQQYVSLRDQYMPL